MLLTKQEELLLSEYIRETIIDKIKNSIDTLSVDWLCNIIQLYNRLCVQENTQIEIPPVQDATKRHRGKPKKGEIVDEGRICALYRANWTIAKIQDDTGYSTKTIYEALKRNGVEKRKG